MDIKGKIKTDTLAYKNILDKQSASKISSGSLVRISGIKTYGVKSYYSTGPGYIESDKVSIIRDEEFYFDNYSSKKFQKNNIALLGARSLSSSIDDIKNERASTYMDLQLFAEDNGTTLRYENGKYVNPETGNAQLSAPASSINGGRGNINYIPTVGGGFSGGIISTVDPSQSSNNVANATIGSTFGLKSDTLVGQIANTVPIGSLFDGSFLDAVATGIMDMIAGFFGNKLSYVIGFDFPAFNLGSLGFSGSSNNSVGGKWSGWTGDTLNRPGVTITYYGTGGSVIPSQYVQNQLPVTDVNRAFERYFTEFGYYIPLEGPLVSSRNLDIIADSRYGFMSDYHTGTASPEKPQAEIQFFKSISDSDYKQVREDLIDQVREDFNISVKRETTFKKFNRFRVPVPDSELGNTRGHIFFTRPDMNLSTDREVLRNGALEHMNHYSQISPLFDNMNKCHAVLMSYLQGKSAGGGDNMIPIMTHCCTGLDIADEVLETEEAHESFTGWKVIYGKSNVKSKTSGTINVAFVDDNMLSMYKILKVWTEYISAVYRGEIKPKAEYGGRHILDYAISIYYFLCKENDEDILFWTKYTGCFPTAAPASNFSDTIDNHISRPTYSVPFSFAKKSDYNPIDIYEFNMLTSEKGNYSFLPTYNENSLHVHKSFVGAPFVDTMDGSHLYKLRWRES